MEAPVVSVSPAAVSFLHPQHAGVKVVFICVAFPPHISFIIEGLTLAWLSVEDKVLVEGGRR